MPGRTLPSKAGRERVHLVDSTDERLCRLSLENRPRSAQHLDQRTHADVVVLGDVSKGDRDIIDDVELGVPQNVDVLDVERDVREAARCSSLPSGYRIKLRVRQLGHYWQVGHNHFLLLAPWLANVLISLSFQNHRSEKRGDDIASNFRPCWIERLAYEQEFRGTAVRRRAAHQRSCLLDDRSSHRHATSYRAHLISGIGCV